MSTMQEMLGLNGGSFQKAEEMARRFIKQGRKEIWLDLAMLAHAQGKLELTRKCHAEYAKHFPNCPRNDFSRSWLMLHDGDLQGGLKHIEKGREIGTLGVGVTAFGNPQHWTNAQLSSPRWDGTTDIDGKTMLLFCEAGIGDQMMCVRAAEWLHDLGARVIVSCSKSLMGLFSRVKYVDAVVTAESPVQHDLHCLSMSTARLCKRRWDNLWTRDYVNAKPSQIWERIIPDGFNIGLRWKGNPQFEHQQLRLFPPEKMFNAVKDAKAKFWSLQKDDNGSVETMPDFVMDLAPYLSSWEETASAISRLSLVITSDTAVAHLAGAIGKPTWIVVPAMCYWPWARPGSKTDWYPSVRIFRQKCYGQWDKPFDEIKQALKELSHEHDARHNP